MEQEWGVWDAAEERRRFPVGLECRFVFCSGVRSLLRLQRSPRAKTKKKKKRVDVQKVFNMPPSPYTQPTSRQAKINDFTNADLPLADASFKRQDDETNVAMETFFFFFLPFVHGNPNNLAACQTVAMAQLSVRTCRGFVLWMGLLHCIPIES